MAEQGLGFQGLIAGKIPEHALDRVRRFLRGAASRGLCPRDLLNPGHLNAAVCASTPIRGYLSVNKSLLQGYVSWLGQSGGVPMIAIASDAYNRAMPAGLHSQGRSRMLLLAITCHEVGHEMMREPEHPPRFVTRVAVLAEKETLRSEEVAGLFAGFLQAFVYADQAGQSQPDKTFEYMM